MVRRWLLSLLLTTLVWANPAWAWGPQGHRAVADIAMANVSPEVADEIRALITAQDGLGTPACAVKSLADASIWPDCLRAQSWRWAYSFDWHFQNGPVCAAAFDIKAHCVHGNCVTAQITRNQRILADKSLPAAQRLEALAFLVHFVGDLHQPLHAADNHDAGGNGVVVSSVPPEPYVIEAVPRSIVVNATPQPISLHWFWDTIVVRRAFAEQPVAALVRRYTPAERAELATGGIEDWAKESWELARTLVYPQAFGQIACAGNQPKQAVITPVQVAQDLPVVRKRLLQAGLRLAKMLDEALGNKPA